MNLKKIVLNLTTKLVFFVTSISLMAVIVLIYNVFLPNESELLGYFFWSLSVAIPFSVMAYYADRIRSKSSLEIVKDILIDEAFYVIFMPSLVATFLFITVLELSDIYLKLIILLILPHIFTNFILDVLTVNYSKLIWVFNLVCTKNRPITYEKISKIIVDKQLKKLDESKGNGIMSDEEFLKRQMEIINRKYEY